MAHSWHYSQGGKQLGPVAPAELRALVTSGRLQPTDLVWKPGMENWVQAVRLKGLFPAATHAANRLPAPSPGTISTPEAEPNTTKRRRFTLKRIAIAIGLFYLLFFAVSAYMGSTLVRELEEESVANQERLQHAIAEGDRLWDSNDKDSAVEAYMPVVNEGYIPWDNVRREVPRVYSRIVDHAASHNDKTLATSVIERAFRAGMSLALKEPAAKELSADVVSRLKTKQDADDGTERLRDTSRDFEEGDKPFETIATGGPRRLVTGTEMPTSGVGSVPSGRTTISSATASPRRPSTTRSSVRTDPERHHEKTVKRLTEKRQADQQKAKKGNVGDNRSQHRNRD